MKTQKKDLTTLAYEKGVQDYLKEIAESGSDVHENYTPAEICDMMLDKVDLTKAETVLVLYNIELLFALKKRKFLGHVTFFTQSEEKAGIAPKIFPNITVEYIDKEENPLYHMENKWPDKFDIVIANPPYSGKLDLKFLDKAFDIAKKEVVFVQPSSFLVDRKKVTKVYSEAKKKIREKLESITLFNGNGIFGIGIYVPCVITKLSMQSNYDEFIFENKITNKIDCIDKCEIENISIFGYRKEFTSIENKISKHICDAEKSMDDKCLYSNPKDEIPIEDFFVEFAQIKGNTKKGNSGCGINDNLYEYDFFVAISKNMLFVKKDLAPKYKMAFRFKSKNEANNFITYMKSDFFRMCLALSKTNQHLDRRELKMVPWMDFAQEWTDEKLFAHFSITEGEQAFIKEVIPPYYD
jgi:hypothetical protein